VRLLLLDAITLPTMLAPDQASDGLETGHSLSLGQSMVGLTRRTPYADAGFSALKTGYQHLAVIIEIGAADHNAGWHAIFPIDP
jgi:hypothetical protein